MVRQGNVYFECPHCGEDVMVGAKVCRECGASDESGWGEDDFGDSWDDEYSDTLYESHQPPSGEPDIASARVRFWVRLIILALVLSFFIGGGLF